MPLYDYNCLNCGDREQFALIAHRHDQKCEKCGESLLLILKPQRSYVPFQPYFDEGLGVAITGRDHRRRVMRDQQCDFRDHPSPGDRSARVDRCMEQRRERRK